MARNPEPEASSRDVPMWFVTYSDVITLLMTFFILLLTFATSEPEQFERMQTTSTTSGSRGLLRPTKDPIQRNSLALRIRPMAGRLSLRGSEMPPLYQDPELTTLSDGLASIDQKLEHLLTENHTLDAQLTLFLDGNKQLSSAGRQWLHMIAQQLQRLPYEVSFKVQSDEDLDRAYALAQHLMQAEGIAPGRISLGVDKHLASRGTSLQIAISRARAAPDPSPPKPTPHASPTTKT